MSANHRDPVSWEKFEAKVTHTRKAKGFAVDTRKREVSIPSYKWDQVVELLATWVNREWYTLLEAAELLGTLNNLSEICQRARPWFFALQQDVRLSRPLATPQCTQNRRVERGLPGALMHRLEPLIQREIAALLWRTRKVIKVTTFVQRELRYLHSYLSNGDNRWAISIGHLVARTNTFVAAGNASNLRGGAHREDLFFWFSLIWSPEIR
jgi:hypothetical protein